MFSISDEYIDQILRICTQQYSSYKYIYICIASLNSIFTSNLEYSCKTVRRWQRSLLRVKGGHCVGDWDAATVCSYD